MKVLILAGGSSNENEVSLRSGTNVRDAVVALGHDAVLVDPADEGFDLKRSIEGVDVVFVALHGAGGEDGRLQKELEELNLPFVGSGSVASALAFDKAKYKARLASEGDITMPTGVVVDGPTFDDSPIIRAPYVLKPIEGGSSLDTYIVHDTAHRPPGVDQTFKRYGELLLEELIDGQEITVGILGDEALPIILIKPPAGEEFDYANKYNGKSQEITNPSEVKAELQTEAKALALRIHKLIGCRHMSRTDMIITPQGKLYVLETNTIPGLTEQSLLPKAAAAAGISMVEMTKRLLELALAG